MKEEDFTHLMGKTRQEVKKELGDGFNFFTDETWTYELSRTWLGRNTILSLDFKDDQVSRIHLYKTFNRT
ncbi:hypothetical protein LF887_09365 [Chryseobacterium sp. MEBOG06]|uniref:hypothetical protein n=1 Tax=Chryseobacterium sp. MEBOG06 TaxID=2879938 RepID=UPI001F2528A0|nr:hypothetical protein [Chryseobacterium sp. MEBOG06]UKB85809.1 hypothetical protein LF887_09365 [Chryseobacterium sp. MEBOG06]